jgi:peroxiredoxin
MMTDLLEPTEGARAIDFTLADSGGKQVSLADYRGKKNVYLFFVREFS